MPVFEAGPPKLVLASASPRRFSLLQQIGVTPDHVIAADIDESVGVAELATSYAKRIAEEKARVAFKLIEHTNTFVLAADTVVCVGRRIIGKPETELEAGNALSLLSGRGHRVMTAIALLTPQGHMRNRIVETRITFKRLSHAERLDYLGSGEWQGKAGGYAIQGLAAVFVTRLVGSYSNVVGLPLAETAALLQGSGYPVFKNWLSNKDAFERGQNQ
jgi:septum formation protein